MKRGVGDNGIAKYVNGLLDMLCSTYPAIGGVDHITTGSGNDQVIGGADSDVIAAGFGNNIVMGDNAHINYAPSRQIESVASTDPGVGAGDNVVVDGGDNIVIGGVGVDTVTVGSSGNNIIFGDDGEVDYTLDGDLATLDLAITTNPDEGEADTITSGGGKDIIFGGTGGDTIHSGGNSDLVFGDYGEVRAVAGGLVSTSLLPLESDISRRLTRVYRAGSLGPAIKARYSTALSG